MWNVTHKILISAGLALAFCLSAHCAQTDIRFRHFSVEDGLSDSCVSSIAQDGLGFIWVGTRNGLNRFNGYSFTVFKHDSSRSNSLPANNVQCLYVDSNKKIWAGFVKGQYSCYDPSLETFTNYSCMPDGSLGGGDVSGFAEDERGNIWVTVDRLGLVRLDPSTGEQTLFVSSESDPESLSHNAVTGIARDKDDFLWISTWGGGINRLDPASGKFSRLPYKGMSDPDSQYGRFKCLSIDSRGRLLAGSTYLGLFSRMDTDISRETEWQVTDDRTGLVGNSVRVICEDRNSSVWVGTTNGISIINDEDGSIVNVVPSNLKNGVSSPDITALTCDASGAVWVGTTNGLYLHNQKQLQFDRMILPDGRAQYGFTQFILKDSSGGIWVKDEHDLHFLHPDPVRTARVSKDIDPVVSRESRSIYEDRAGNIWFGMNSDYVVRYTPASGKSRRIPMNGPGDPDERKFRTVYGFYEDDSGTIWISCEIGLLGCNPSTLEMQPLFRSGELIHPEFKVTTVLRDWLGNLWVGTQGGLRRYGSDMARVCTYAAGDGSCLTDSDITALCEDTDGNFWVGTASGLNKYDRASDSFTTLERPFASSGTPVRGLVDDRNGHLWISTSNGLVRYGYRDNSFNIFDENDGLMSREAVSGAICRGRDGEILVGTVNGVNRFYPADIETREGRNHVIIEDFQIFNSHVSPAQGSFLPKSISMTEKIVLSHKQSTLSFQFASPDFVSPGKVQYAYRMDGVDNDWISTPSDRRSATYANLSPGRYVFRVRAAGDDGIWDEDETSLGIQIKPPFYRTVFAYVLYGMILLALAAFAIGAVRRRNRMQMERIMERQQHEMDEMKIRFFTNISHEFRTSLTLIMGPLKYLRESGREDTEGKRMLDIMQRSSSRLLRLVNQLLDFRKVEAGKMEIHNSVHDIVGFLREEFSTYRFYAEEKNLDYIFVCPEESIIMSFDTDKVEKVVYNLLSNAFKYTDSGGKVVLSLEKTEKEGAPFVKISVSDDGIGIPQEIQEHIFTRFFQEKDGRTMYRGGSGLGLNMTHEFVTLMGGSITVDSSPGNGTCFTVLIPEIEGTAAPETAEEEDSGTAPEQIQLSDEKALILLVEDNRDMRRYIKTIIGGKNCQIAEASDGEEGLRKTIELMPDIVISDVMMAGMDGFEMLGRIKEDERISHIPVIMLTAITDESRVLEAYRTGTDDYITKPFNPSILRARIANILSRRKDDWEKKMFNDNPFVSSLMDLINLNSDNPSLNVDLLADKLCLSPAQLTRKTKSIMGNTPFTLIRKARMEKAVKLMKETDLNISAIADKCGYPEISNFSRAFTQYWGETPSKVMKKYRKNL